MFRYFRKGVLAAFITLLVLAAGHSDYRPTAFDLAVAPYRYSLVNWEVSHFMDKWLGKLGDLMPWSSQPSREERIALAQEYFDLNPRLQELERLRRDEAAGRGVRKTGRGVDRGVVAVSPYPVNTSCPELTTRTPKLALFHQEL